ncbi:tRNA pseudouridine(38-40) synthase TruA [Chitinivorax sp. PXF-14]|uniref:tRNA pseudouridine(38-40) synthase TruA n=1 Tax=Chitinivorax sp. PXF-14 TaxID=3230488 RepID=UPI0034661E04
MMRIALGLEYDGRPYNGWQSQPNRNTVQDKLEAALSELASEPVAVFAAGRTDAGVHAAMQVVHFDTTANRPLTAWVRGVNRYLPASIAVRWAQPVADDFHARFSAVGRRYRYLLFSHPVRSALLQGRAGWCHNQLNVDFMREAAAYLLGEHDFSAFRAAECQAKSPVKQLTQLGIRLDDGLISLELRANAFLHHMVRNIVGCLVYVGSGRHPPEWMRDVLLSRDRKLAAPTFSPDGLYLSGVEYPPDSGLAELARGGLILPRAC